MSKAVLVIDMPKHCDDCPFRVLWAKYHCVVNGKYCGNEQGFYSSSTKPSWCPLKPLPEKRDLSYGTEGTEWYAYSQGYNACIDEIVGDENEQQNS